MPKTCISRKIHLHTRTYEQGIRRFLMTAISLVRIMIWRNSMLHMPTGEVLKVLTSPAGDEVSV